MTTHFGENFEFKNQSQRHGSIIKQQQLNCHDIDRRNPAFGRVLILEVWSTEETEGKRNMFRSHDFLKTLLDIIIVENLFQM